MMWGVSGGLVALAGLSLIAERRRGGRTDPDAMGFVPWSLVLVLSILGAAVCAALALKGL